MSFMKMIEKRVEDDFAARACNENELIQGERKRIVELIDQMVQESPSALGDGALIEELKKDKSAAEEAVNSIKEKSKEVLRKLKASHDAKLAELQEQLESAKQESLSLKDQLAELEECNQKLLSTSQTAVSSEEIEEMKLRVSNLQEELEREREQKSKAMEQLEKCAEDHSAEMDRLNSDMQRQIENLMGEVKELREKEIAIQDRKSDGEGILNEKLLELERQLEEAVSGKTSAENSLENVRAKSKEMLKKLKENADSQSEQLRERIKELESERDALQISVHEAGKCLSEQREVFSVLERHIDKIETSVEQSGISVEHTIAQDRCCFEEIASKVELSNKNAEALDTLLLEIKQRKEEMLLRGSNDTTHTAQDLSLLEEENAVFKRRIESLELDISDLNEEIAALRSSRESLTSNGECSENNAVCKLQAIQEVDESTETWADKSFVEENQLFEMCQTVLKYELKRICSVKEYPPALDETKGSSDAMSAIHEKLQHMGIHLVLQKAGETNPGEDDGSKSGHQASERCDDIQNDTNDNARLQNAQRDRNTAKQQIEPKSCEPKPVQHATKRQQHNRRPIDH
eukprot:529353-Hanusia_phi.AAC.2